MLTELAGCYPVVAHTFQEASDALGYDLWAIVSNGPIEKLNETEVTQPAMLTAGVAIWRVWNELGGPQPNTLAGHSLGEYTALVCAEALTFTDAVSLVADRGRFMQNAIPPGEGAMAAILGLDDDVIVAACERAVGGEVVAAVNFNSPGQVVIAGHRNAVNRAVEVAKEEGAKRAVVLSVSVPSHCQLMEPAAHDLAERLQKTDINVPKIAVINNVDVVSETDPYAIADALIRQLCNPVLWAASINKMVSEGVDTLVECGPGGVLTGLNRRINRSIKGHAIYSPETLEKTLEQIH